MDSAIDLNALSPEQLRQLSGELLQAKTQLETTVHQLTADKDRLAVDRERLAADKAQLTADKQQLATNNKQLTIHNEHLIHELAILRRHRFGRRSEQSGSGQFRLLDEIVEEDMSATEEELDTLTADKSPSTPRQRPKRQALPASLPRTEIHHDPDSTSCRCGCQMVHVGDDISEKLDYEPGTFKVEQHIRSKWACKTCETITQAPVPPHIIDKGIPTAGLLAHVLVSK